LELRRSTLIRQVKTVETERDALLAPAARTEQTPAPQAMLMDLKGIGAEFAPFYARGLYQSFVNPTDWAPFPPSWRARQLMAVLLISAAVIDSR
jgi:hypothetical protein